MAWSDAEHDSVIQALAVVCELTATELSDAAKRFMVDQLKPHAASQVVIALHKCACEVKGRLTLADVIKAMGEVDRKALSDARASRSSYLTQLRGLALMERIAWDENDPDEVRRQLEARGYKLGSVPEKPKALPHWTESTERE